MSGFCEPGSRITIKLRWRRTLVLLFFIRHPLPLRLSFFKILSVIRAIRVIRGKAL